ncbi:aldehyde dehydrogenase (NAD(+)) [Saccharomycopsis crataegensis]|uniref:Aldehyde dehydrogenase (NAD(+)) n=1 Tax=Saccharomycopsis crataegensis TaxID=43959 RepID=A0AAV5QQC3_9ASCO|nr:aldehyde dehydrogenase (NAD(+)) [Saccharomycopsis crataegensis]
MVNLPDIISIELPDGQKYDQPTGLFINNEFIPSIKKTTWTSINPATEEENATVYCATEEDVDNAIGVARGAFKSTWKKFPAGERSKLILKLADLIDANKLLLAGIEAYDSGKPKMTNCLYDIEDVANVFRYYGGWADKIQGKTIPIDGKHLSYTIHEPHGVVGQIIPWNYPLDMLAWKIAPAIAAGNTVVLKTSELTPLSALYFGKLIVEAGIPPGVVNILTGTGSVVGKYLAGHPGIDKVAFTGSTKVGKLVQSLASTNLNSVSMETGGKSPAIVFDDANIDKTLYWTAMGIFYNSGQVCSATSRILVQDTIYDEFVERFREFSEKSYRCGDPFSDAGVPEDDVTIIGPQISGSQKTVILEYIESGQLQGARLILGGCEQPVDLKKGYYVQPTIFADVTPEMKIFKEEIFGPVVTITKFSTTEEAIELANRTEYGLGGSIFTKDLAKAHLVSSDLEIGTIWVNSSNESSPQVPFGGVKMSGFGRELGEYSLQLYTQVKSITINFE